MSENALPVASSGHFMVSCLIFKSLSQFSFWSWCLVWGSVLISLICMTVWPLQHHLPKRLLFSVLSLLASLMVSWSWACGFISVLSLRFRWPAVSENCCRDLVPKVCLTLLWPRGLWPAGLLLSLGLPRQEHWSRSPFPSAGKLPDPGIEPVSPALAGRVFTTEALGTPSTTVPWSL